MKRLKTELTTEHRYQKEWNTGSELQNESTALKETSTQKSNLPLVKGFNRQIGIVRGAVASQTWWLSERRMPWYLTTRPESESRRNN